MGDISMKYLLSTLLSLLLTAVAFAKIVGFDDRRVLSSNTCDATPATMARVLVPVDGKPYLSTAFAATSNGAVYFVATAHSFYREGQLRAPIHDIEVNVLIDLGSGECRFETVGIRALATATQKPHASFFDASRDLAIFLIDDAALSAKLRPIEIAATPIRRTNTNLFAFAWNSGRGLLPFVSECSFRKKSGESRYDDISFLHHDCDTGSGASGAVMLCDPVSLTATACGLHTVGWGEDGRRYSDGVYNVAIPLSSRTVAPLLQKLR